MTLINALKKKNIHSDRQHIDDNTSPKPYCNLTYDVCWYCREKTPQVSRCKARSATCNRCQKRGHYKRVWGKKLKNVNKTIYNIITTPRQQVWHHSPWIVLGKVHCKDAQRKERYVNMNISISINGGPLTMKIN